MENICQNHTNKVPCDTRRTEEIVQVCVEVRDVSVRADERQDFPVSIGALPEVPGVTGNVEAAENLRADWLDAGYKEVVLNVGCIGGRCVGLPAET